MPRLDWLRETAGLMASQHQVSVTAIYRQSTAMLRLLWARELLFQRNCGFNEQEIKEPVDSGEKCIAQWHILAVRK
jgi:hypothetical protein